jgi:hypothetical protein
MSSTEWRHSYSCCSEKCGLALRDGERRRDLDLGRAELELQMAESAVRRARAEVERLKRP